MRSQTQAKNFKTICDLEAAGLSQTTSSFYFYRFRQRPKFKQTIKMTEQVIFKPLRIFSRKSRSETSIQIYFLLLFALFQVCFSSYSSFLSQVHKTTNKKKIITPRKPLKRRMFLTFSAAPQNQRKFITIKKLIQSSTIHIERIKIMSHK